MFTDRQKRKGKGKAADMDEIRRVIKQYWGYEELLPHQEEAMACVAEGRDSLLVLPTGGGKSLCFQAPALVQDGLALVVSPLISLMQDQVDTLRECGVPGACLNSTTMPEDRRGTLSALAAGRLKLLYISPERLAMEGFRDFLRGMKLSFIAIDEAHCISMWGHDFRPEYRRLQTLKQDFPDLPVHAYTATATDRVKEDIIRQLALADPTVLTGSFFRPNLIYSVQRRQGGDGGVKRISAAIEKHRGEAGIIYCITRKATEKLAHQLNLQGHRTLPYHAGLDDHIRRSNQETFIREDGVIIVATVAFGMGIDKSNVRYVIHAGMPKSLEHYQQESGRAGRDGLEAECLLLYSLQDLHIWRTVMGNEPSEGSEIALSKLDGMLSYCTNATCRHEMLLNYFGEQFDQKCNACDICREEVDLVAEPMIIGQKILSCVFRLGENFGAHHTSMVLAGSSERALLRNSHDQLSTYGILKNHRRQTLRDWISQLVGQKFLHQEGEYRLLKITDKGWDLLKGNLEPRLLQPATPTTTPTPKRARIEDEAWENVDRELFEVLRKLRLGLAHERGVPPFVVFGDKTLRQMARYRPVSAPAMLSINGVGDKKMEAYGDLFMATIQAFCQRQTGEKEEQGAATD